MSKIEFKLSKDQYGNDLTKCYSSNDEGNILAIMVENASVDFNEPLFLKKSIDVLIPIPSEKNRTTISIWYSPDENLENLSSIIQSFFEFKFPNLLLKEKISMSLNHENKLIVSCK